MRKATTINRLVMTTLAVAIFATLAFSANAAASDGIDVPVDRLANALGISTTAAGYLLALGFLAAIAIAASVVGAKTEAVGILLIVGLVAFAFLGWVEYWLVILAAFLVVIMFVAPIARGGTRG